MTRALIALLTLLSVHAHGAMMTGGWDWEARNWKTNVALKAGTLSGRAFVVGTQFMQSTKRWGVRQLLGRVNLYLGDQTNAMSCPIIHTWSSTSDDGLDAFVNFVSADYTEATGLTGNATTKHLLLNDGFAVNLSDFTTINDLHLACYVRTPTNEQSYTMGVAYGGANATVGLPVSYANNSYLELSSTANQINTPDTNGVGFYVATKTATNSRALYKNGSSILTSSATDTAALSSGSIVVHAFNSAGAITAWNSRTLSYYAYGYGVPANRITAYRIAVRNVQVAMGRNVE